MAKFKIPEDRVFITDPIDRSRELTLDRATDVVRLIFFLILLILPFCVLLIQLTDASKQNALAATEILPPIHVQGNKIMTDTGQQVILRGVNRGNGPEHACMRTNGINGPTDLASVQAMLNWKINTVRIPLNEDCWLGINGAVLGGAAYQQLIIDYVNLLNQNQIYAVVDLHINAPGMQRATALEKMADADHALDFWASVATAFKGNDRVIFDLFNEPHVSGPCWLNGGTAAACGTSFQIVGMQQMLNTVRATGATNIVIAGGISDSSQWFSYTPSDPLKNIMTGFHLYGNSPRNCGISCIDSNYAEVIAQVLVYVGEFGESYDASGCTTTFISSFASWMDSKQLNYTIWTWNPGSGCATKALISDWSGTPLSHHGIWYQNYLNTVVTQAPPSLIPLPTPTSQQVLAVNLVNVSTNAYILTITSGQTINLAVLPTTCLTLRAITNPSPVGSVLFSYDGDNAYHIENNFPYDINSDSGTSPLPNCWSLTVGSHSLLVRPFSNSNASDTAGTPLSLNFTVINQPPTLT
jgi:endoglucanase